MSERAKRVADSENQRPQLYGFSVFLMGAEIQQSNTVSGEPATGSDRLGLFFALAGASGLGLAVAWSRLAYEGGTDGVTVAASRAVLTVLILLAWCRWQRVTLKLERKYWWHAGGLGVLASIMFWGNIAAVQYISVGLAALLFYTYPPMVAVGYALWFRDRVPLPKAVLLGVAFAGLALMLGVSLESADIRGMGLSLFAAVATAWNAIWIARSMRGVDPLALTFYMTVVAAVVLQGVLAVHGGPTWPSTDMGWVGYIGTASIQALSVPLYFLGLARIGALKSAMLSNIQPVVSIVAAWLMFGDLLGFAQFVGGAMVLGAIVLVQLYDNRQQHTN